MRKATILLAGALVVSIALVGFAGSASAAKVGISGSCDDDDQDHVLEGEGGTQVDTESPETTVTDLQENPGGDQLANTGFVWFALGSGNNDACDRDPNQEDNGDDYLEAHASAGGNQVKFCQSEGHHEDGHVHAGGQTIDFNESDTDDGHDGDCAYKSDGNHGGSGSDDDNNANPLAHDL